MTPARSAPEPEPAHARDDPSSDTHPRERARSAVAAFFSALACGRPNDAVSRCTPGTVWWLPAGPDEDVPIDLAARQLMQFVGPACSPADALIIASAGGDTVAVEQSVRPPDSDMETTVTSVVHLREGMVISGRTYADVAAWGTEASPGKSEQR